MAAGRNIFGPGAAVGICEGAAEGVGPRGGEGLSHFLGDAIGCWGGGRGRGSSGSVGFFFFFLKKILGC